MLTLEWEDADLKTHIWLYKEKRYHGARMGAQKGPQEGFCPIFPWESTRAFFCLTCHPFTLLLYGSQIISSKYWGTIEHICQPPVFKGAWALHCHRHRRIIAVGRDHERHHLFQPPLHWTGTPTAPSVLRASSSLTWNVSRDGAFTTPLGNPFLCFTLLIVKDTIRCRGWTLSRTSPLPLCMVQRKLSEQMTAPLWSTFSTATGIAAGCKHLVQSFHQSHMNFEIQWLCSLGQGFQLHSPSIVLTVLKSTCKAYICDIYFMKLKVQRKEKKISFFLLLLRLHKQPIVNVRHQWCIRNGSGWKRPCPDVQSPVCYQLQACSSFTDNILH